MSISIHQASVPAFVRGLNVLSALLTKGEEHVAASGGVPDMLLGARLAEDMLPLTAQIQRASDASKFTVARLCGIEAPKFEDNEASFQQLRERIAQTIAFLESVPEEQFAGAEKRDVTLTYGAFSQHFTGLSYLQTFALPNFYFHVTTAYGILRAQGVKIGKLDFLGPFN